MGVPEEHVHDLPAVPRKRRPAWFRDEAVLAYSMKAGSDRVVAECFGVHRGTLMLWVKRARKAAAVENRAVA